MAQQLCMFCKQPATVGPCENDEGLACNHRVTCRHCGLSSLLSVNLSLIPCPYATDLPLFQEAV